MEAIADDGTKFLSRLPVQRQKVWRYYRLAGIAADGYPLMTSSDGVVAHPIHGTYMGLELLRGLKASDGEGLDEVERLLEAAVSRMEDDGSTLRFMYRAGSGLTPYPSDFYSALTQAHYLNVFGRLLDLRPTSRVRELLQRIFRSLLIPIDSGGVLHDRRGILSFEEFPSPIPNLVLNGWLTVLNEVFEYGVMTNNTEALSLVLESTQSLATLLERYDAVEAWSSRYRLTGNVSHRIVFQGAVPEIVDIVVGHAGYEARVQPSEAKPHSLAHIASKPTKIRPTLTLKAAASVIHYPEPSRVSVRFKTIRKCRVTWNVLVPEFDPAYVTPRGASQQQISSTTLGTGEHTVTQEIPAHLVFGWVAPPTAFSKVIEDNRFNVYHYLHIKALTQLHHFTGLPELKFWRDRWLSYVEEWPTFALYDKPGFNHGVVDRGSYSSQSAYLMDPRVKFEQGRIVRSTPSGNRVE